MRLETATQGALKYGSPALGTANGPCLISMTRPKISSTCIQQQACDKLASRHIENDMTIAHVREKTMIPRCIWITYVQ